MTPIFARQGLRESWETYRNRYGGKATRQQWREQGWRLLGWDGPGTPCRTPRDSVAPLCTDESAAEGEARPAGA